MYLNELDFIMILILFVSGMIGILRGLIREVLQLASISLAAFSSIVFRKYLTFIFTFIESELIKEAISGALIFIFMFIVGSIIIYLICQTIKTQGFGKFIDKILGLQYGILRGVLLLMVSVILVENNHNITNNNWWQNSLFLGKIQSASVSLFKAVPLSWKEKIEQFKE